MELTSDLSWSLQIGARVIFPRLGNGSRRKCNQMTYGCRSLWAPWMIISTKLTFSSGPWIGIKHPCAPSNRPLCKSASCGGGRAIRADGMQDREIEPFLDGKYCNRLQQLSFVDEFGLNEPAGLLLLEVDIAVTTGPARNWRDRSARASRRCWPVVRDRDERVTQGARNRHRRQFPPRPSPLSGQTGSGHGSDDFPSYYESMAGMTGFMAQLPQEFLGGRP